MRRVFTEEVSAANIEPGTEGAAGAGTEFANNILGVRELEGDHSGENQAKVIIAVILDFQIATKLGFFVVDNDGRNDTLCSSLSGCKSVSCSHRKMRY